MPTAVAEVFHRACAARPDAFFLPASGTLVSTAEWFWPPAVPHVPANADSAEELAAATAPAVEYSPDDWLRADCSPGDYFPDGSPPDDYSGRADSAAAWSARIGWLPGDCFLDDYSASVDWAADGSARGDWLPGGYFLDDYSPDEQRLDDYSAWADSVAAG